jgi:hypothetical protein
MVFCVTTLAVVVGLAVQGHAFSFRSSGDGTYAFMQHQEGNPNVPVTYSSCKPVRVELNLDGVTEKDLAKQVILGAMGEMSAASGLQLQYVGETKRRPRWPDPTLSVEGGAWPVIVAFATADEVADLRGNAGLGGSTTVRNDWGYVYVTGTVALETGYFNGLLGRRGGPVVGRAIVMHELGHVLGLTHVKDRHEVMNGRGVGTNRLGRGDRLGLARLGQGPCF